MARNADSVLMQRGHDVTRRCSDPTTKETPRGRQGQHVPAPPRRTPESRLALREAGTSSGMRQAHVVSPAVEAHTDTTRVIGLRTTCDSAEHPYLRGYEVVVLAVLKDALCIEDCERLTTEEAVRAAGGVGRDDRLEVAPILPGEGLSFVTSDPRAVDVRPLEGLSHVALHGPGPRQQPKPSTPGSAPTSRRG